MRPTAMLFRNLVSMDVEESIRADPLDGVILLAGCDKTTPALLMGAASCDIPAIMISGGPMLNGKFQGHDIGSGTDVWRFSEDVRRGVMSECDFLEAEGLYESFSRSLHDDGNSFDDGQRCRSTWHRSANQRCDSCRRPRRYALAHMAGQRIVEMVHEDLDVEDPDARAFENAIRVVGAIGGSTNAVIHLLAIAGRIGVELTLDDWDRLGRGVPCLVNLMPSGKYLMEDFFYAGGLPAVIEDLGDLINSDALTVNGKTIGENVAGARCYNRDVIKPKDEPLTREGGLAILRGNLCPDGAVLKPSAATPELMRHRGRAVVFETIEDFHARIDDPNLDIDETCVMVLKNCGPRGYPGMPEVGNMPLPPKILKRGITDMVRISDARMSGTAYGTAVLHVSPEAAAGGVLALVENGDHIELNVDERRLHLDVDDAELSRRRSLWRPPAPPSARGYYKLYYDHVTQADRALI